MNSFLFCPLLVGVLLFLGCSVPSKNMNGKPAVPAAGIFARENGEILAEHIVFDMTTGKISYFLPRPALVRIRIGVREGGAMLVNLLDWELRGAGAHEEIWDRRDKNGMADYSQRADLMLVIACLDPESPPREESGRQIRGLRKAPGFQISLPENQGVTAEGVTVVSGVTLIRLMVDPQDIKWLLESKFEIAVYIDDVFLMEEEEGINPFNYRFNTVGLNDGLHTVTANVVSNEGEIGVATLPFMVRNKS